MLDRGRRRAGGEAGGGARLRGARGATRSTSRSSPPSPRRRLARLRDSRVQAVRSRSASAPRRRCAAPTGRDFEVAKGAPQAIAALVAARTAGQAMERGGRGLRGARLPLARGRPSRRREQRLAAAWGAAAARPAARGLSRATIAEAGALGLAVKMVTGDRVEIAREVAREVGLGERDPRGQRARASKAPGSPHASRPPTASRRSCPEHKYRIVEALQQAGHIVAMTGDGVNDAPALRRADAGVAVAGATDAARAAADIVLLAPGLSVIVEALARKPRDLPADDATTRSIGSPRRSASSSSSPSRSSRSAIFPVTAAMIVLLALLNDAAILSIAFDRVQASALPERWNMREVLTDRHACSASSAWSRASRCCWSASTCSGSATTRCARSCT